MSLSIADRETMVGKALYPVNGLEEFGGIRDAAPDAWGRLVIEARHKVPANSLMEADYLLEAGGDRVGALDVRKESTSPDSASASNIQSLEYILQAAEAVEYGAPVPANLENFLGAGPSAGGARPKATVRDDQGALWLAKFPAKGDTFDGAQAETWILSPLYDVVPRPGVAYERRLHLHVGEKGKLATLDNALSYHTAFMAERSDALGLIRRVWSEIRQWKTCFEAMGANGTLIGALTPAFRELEHIASSELATEIRRGN